RRHRHHGRVAVDAVLRPHIPVGAFHRARRHRGGGQAGDEEPLSPAAPRAAALPAAWPHRHADPAFGGRAEALRHDLHHDARRAGHGDGAHLHLHPACRLSRLRSRGGVRAGDPAAPAHDPPEPALHPYLLPGDPVMVSRPAARFAHLAGLVLVFVFAMFPFYWMVSSSFKDQADLLASPPMWLFEPTIKHYAEILADQKVTSAIVNSLIVAVSTTALAVLLGTPAAYALARFEFRGKSDLWFWFISNRMISPIVLALPVYLL